MGAYKSVLHEMSMTTPTQFWNDSCSIPELNYAIEHGGVGATTNPVIVGQVLKAELETYVPLIRELIAAMPKATEDDVAWALNERMAQDGAKKLLPVFERTGGKAGFISIQTNAKYYRDAEKMAAQAVHFSGLAPNIMVKIPVTAAGIAAIEEATYEGVNVNATVSFTVPQSIAVAEAIARGLSRRERAGRDNSGLFPVCTIMVGRIEDWLREVMNAENITVDPIAIDMSGVAVFKNAYRIYRERGYHTRLLAAAFRNHYHWSQFIGGDVSMTITHKWIRQFIESDIPCENRMDTPVDPKLVAQLKKHFPDFVRAYEPDGLRIDEFDGFGATRRTLAQFLKGYDDMVAIIRGFIVG
ncbi:MAG: transaldolase family protein [Clostridiales bacterium]|jgi:transaldolase|nr:transaldolase family protein [Clostridiales bacterium]